MLEEQEYNETSGRKHECNKRLYIQQQKDEKTKATRNLKSDKQCTR